MPRYIDADAFLLAEIERCGSQPVVGTCTMDNEYLSIRIATAPTLSPDEVRGVGCPVCQCEEPLPEDAMTHEFYIRGSMLWYYDQLFGWEGKRIAFCPFCGKRLRMKGGNNGHEKAD